MRKIYVLALTFGCCAAGFAQMPLAKRQNDFSSIKASPKVQPHEKSTPLWSDDFSTPSNWVISNAGSGGTPPHTSGDWVITTDVNAIPVTALSPAGFPTAANGYAMVNSDAAGQTATQNTRIVTANAIDLTGVTHATLRFSQIYRHYMETYNVIVSNDNGATWTTFQVNATANSNTNSANPEECVVNISAVAGNSAQVKIGFQYIGAWDFFWAVDDVEIDKTPQYDIAYTGLYYGSLGYWGARLPYGMVPTAQVQPITIGGIGKNNGYATQSDIKFTAAVASEGYTSQSTDMTLASDEIDTIDVAADFTPSGNGTYVISGAFTTSATDSTPADNVNAAAATVIVNNSVYARDLGDANSATANDGNEYVTGSVFDMYAPATLYGADVFIGGTTEVDHDVLVRLYTPGTSDAFDILAEATHTVVAGEPGTMITVWFDDPIDLVADTSYLLAAGGYGDNGATDDITIGVNGSSEPQTTFIYDPTASNGPWFYTSYTPVVRMNFSNSMGLKENTADFGMNVYPNPANDAAKVSFTLPNAGNATISVLDVTGKVVYTTALDNTAAGKQVVDLNTAGFAAGSYMVKITTADAMSTKKLVVRK